MYRSALDLQISIVYLSYRLWESPMTVTQKQDKKWKCIFMLQQSLWT